MYVALTILSSLADLAGALPIAHEIGRPHDEIGVPADDGDTSPIVIVAALAGTMVLLAALIWLKRRSEAQDAVPGQGDSA